jgi:RNA polymerase sigma factor (sigma-70 family)
VISFNTNLLPNTNEEIARLTGPGAILTPALFENIYETFFDRVYNYFSFRVSSREEAEDLTAQVFEQLMRRFRQYDPARGPFQNWLFGIARNALASQFRAKKRHPQTGLDEAYEEDSAVGPAQQILQLEELSRLLGYINRLSERDRDLIALRYGAEMSHREIGEVLKMKESAVAVALGRAVQRLRRLFEKDEIL